MISAVSLWEMRLKWQALHAGGGRKGPVDPARAWQVLRGQPLPWLALTCEHIVAVLKHPLSHHDPFDALLLAQAHCEKLLLLTRDRLLVGHPLARAAG